LLRCRYPAARPGVRLCALFLFAITTLAHAAPFKAVSVFDAAAIQGRAVELDSQGKLLPWPMPQDIGASYQSYFLTQWTYLRQQYQGERYYYFYCCVDFDHTTFVTTPDRSWANSTGYLRAMLEGFVEHLYPYTGDAEALDLLKDFVDYELVNGTTPHHYVWNDVPYASADPGAKKYTGWSRHAVDFVEPPIVGESGYGYLRLYEMTFEVRYLRAAIRCADALVKNLRPGDAQHSPWAVRVFARTGKVGPANMGEYSANMIEPIELFDELIRLQQGDVVAYQRARDQAWQWLLAYPMKNNIWVGYFEDVPPSMANMNSVIPLETARYLLLHPEKDADWKAHAAALIQWVKATPKWPKYVVHGATITTEQGDGNKFCCGPPNVCCDSHTARLAAVEAMYAWKTGDSEYAEQAFRSYNWVTYLQGFPPKGQTSWGPGQWWFTDEFADGPRRMMDGLWAVPTWAPQDESHFLGTSSVVTRIAYGRGSVNYSTFDADADDVLRLDFVPTKISASGRVVDPQAAGKQQSDRFNSYTFDVADKILRVHHVDSRDINIEGEAGAPVARMIDFDVPILAAGTLLSGQYPTGVVDWGKDVWQVNVPHERWSTFNLRLADTQSRRAAFAFVSPRILAGMTVFNESSVDVSLTMHSAENADVTAIIRAGQLRRIRTQWQFRTSQVNLETGDAASLKALSFDDLMYWMDGSASP
jgi:hypothetical protein